MYFLLICNNIYILIAFNTVYVIPVNAVLLILMMPVGDMFLVGVCGEGCRGQSICLQNFMKYFD